MSGSIKKPATPETTPSVEFRLGRFHRIWCGEGFYLVSVDDQPDEALAADWVGAIQPWCIEQVLCIAARREPDAPWLCIVGGGHRGDKAETAALFSGTAPKGDVIH